MLWVNADTPYKTAKDYLDAVKAGGPNKFKMGGTGSKQEDQIITVAIEKATGEKDVNAIGYCLGGTLLAATLAWLTAKKKKRIATATFIVGVDLIKDTQVLQKAYCDSLGVTAAFNLNLLARINRDLGGQFDLKRFAHEVRFDADTRSVDMHLRSLDDQQVSIPGADLVVRLARNETIWTESSHKYLAEEVAAMGETAGFRCDGQWIDRIWPFADTLFGVA